MKIISLRGRTWFLIYNIKNKMPLKNQQNIKIRNYERGQFRLNDQQKPKCRLNATRNI